MDISFFSAVAVFILNWVVLPLASCTWCMFRLIRVIKWHLIQKSKDKQMTISHSWKHTIQIWSMSIVGYLWIPWGSGDYPLPEPSPPELLLACCPPLSSFNECGWLWKALYPKKHCLCWLLVRHTKPCCFGLKFQLLCPKRTTTECFFLTGFAQKVLSVSR